MFRSRAQTFAISQLFRYARSGAVPYGQQRELLVISRALGINLLEFFVEITKQPSSDGG
jgi:hypothetical protein